MTQLEHFKQGDKVVLDYHNLTSLERGFYAPDRGKIFIVESIGVCDQKGCINVIENQTKKKRTLHESLFTHAPKIQTGVAPINKTLFSVGDEVVINYSTLPPELKRSYADLRNKVFIVVEKRPDDQPHLHLKEKNSEIEHFLVILEGYLQPALKMQTPPPPKLNDTVVLKSNSSLYRNYKNLKFDVVRIEGTSYNLIRDGGPRMCVQQHEIKVVPSTSSKPIDNDKSNDHERWLQERQHRWMPEKTSCTSTPEQITAALTPPPTPDIQRVLLALRDTKLSQRKIAEVGLKWIATLLRKNADYGDSVFTTPAIASCDALTAIKVRICDKWNRLQSLSQKQAEIEESFDDTIMDLGAYCLLYLCVKEIQNEMATNFRNDFGDNKTNPVV